MNSIIIKYLNVLLSDLSVFSVKIHNFHWNVISSDFGLLHKLFDELYELLLDDIDLVAERIRALQSKPFASLTEFLNNSTISEVLIDANLTDVDMLRHTLADLEVVIGKIITTARLTQEDLGTNNLLMNMVEILEKKAWMVRSHL